MLGACHYRYSSDFYKLDKIGFRFSGEK